MTHSQKQLVQDTVEAEGDFYYTFAHYSDFGEIKDPKFHALRKKFLEAADALAEYIGVEI